jgi:hypothetical protein
MTTKTIDPINGRGACIDDMLSRFAEPLGLARALSEKVEAFVSEQPVVESKPHALIATGLLLRLASGLRSLCLLAANGFYTEALGHQRCLMEALTRIAAIAQEPDLLNDYVAQDVLNDVKLREDILRFRADWPRDIAREPSDEELLQKLSEHREWLATFKEAHGRKARDIKTFDWALSGGIEHLLLGRFVMASAALHCSPKSLEHLFVMDGERIASLRTGPSREDLDHLILSSCKYLFVGIERAASILAIEVPEDVKVLHGKFEVLFEQRAAAALDSSTPL